jgi:hypothetical protein
MLPSVQLDHVGTPLELAVAAQWPTCMLPYQRFVAVLAGRSA